MIHVILSSLVLSIIHATIPNHWLPLVAIGKVEKWSTRTTLWATAISGTAHVASTILIGIIVGYAGYKLSESYHWISSFAAPLILIALGTIYILRNFFGHHHHHHFDENPPKDASFSKVVLAISVGMFFSPCVELESYYFTAGTFGWTGIIGVSIIYLLVTVIFMVVYVALAIEGINRYKFQFLEKNEKLIIGIVLIVVGIATHFINLH